MGSAVTTKQLTLGVGSRGFVKKLGSGKGSPSDRKGTV